MEKQIKAMIKILAIDLNEAVFDMEFDGLKFHSIEWKRDEDEVILHHLTDTTDYEFPLLELDKDTQRQIYNHLLMISTR